MLQRWANLYYLEFSGYSVADTYINPNPCFTIIIISYCKEICNSSIPVQGRRHRSGCTVLTGPRFLPAVSVSDPFYYIIVCSCTTSHVHRYDLLLASALTSHATKCGDPCLICYWTHQHVVSYKVTKLAVPLQMATIADVRESISSLPDEPHHPKHFAFLKQSFGKTKPVFCKEQVVRYLARM